MAEFTTGNGKNSVRNDVKAAMGTVDVEAGKETLKTPVMSFSEGNVYLGLKLVSYYDEKNNVRKEPVPKITASFNGKFVEVPLNGKWWKSYADFVSKMAQAMEGVDLANSNINDDVEYAKTLMAKFRTVA